MSDINDMILEEARKYIGTFEWAGKDHNPEVLSMYADAGHPEIREDEVPWCAAYVGAVLGRLGLQHTGSLLAKSYLKWGTKVASLEEAKPGDIIVFHRGNKSWQGHVGFLVGYSTNQIKVVGGNQNNQVSVAGYPRSKLAGIRRVKKPKSSMAQSTTLRAGAVTAGGVGTAAATAAPVIQGLDSTAQIIIVCALVVAGLGLAWIARERIKSFLAGWR